MLEQSRYLEINFPSRLANQQTITNVVQIPYRGYLEEILKLSNVPQTEFQDGTGYGFWYIAE